MWKVYKYTLTEQCAMFTHFLTRFFEAAPVCYSLCMFPQHTFLENIVPFLEQRKKFRTWSTRLTTATLPYCPTSRVKCATNASWFSCSPGKYKLIILVRLLLLALFSTFRSNCLHTLDLAIKRYHGCTKTMYFLFQSKIVHLTIFDFIIFDTFIAIYCAMCIVAMMHSCTPGQSTRQCCIQWIHGFHASCRPYGVETLPMGRHDAQISWCCRLPIEGAPVLYLFSNP